MAIGADREGRRQVLGVELANRESRASWRDFLSGLKTCGTANGCRPASDRVNPRHA